METATYFVIAALPFVVGSALAVARLMSLISSGRRLQNPIADLDSAKGSHSTGFRPEHRLVLQALLVQQRWSFALVWIAVALSVAMSAVLVGRIVLLQQFQAAELGGVLATAADIWVGKASWTLYTNASARIEKVIGLQPAAVSSPATT